MIGIEHKYTTLPEYNSVKVNNIIFSHFEINVSVRTENDAHSLFFELGLYDWMLFFDGDRKSHMKIQKWTETDSNKPLEDNPY